MKSLDTLLSEHRSIEAMLAAVDLAATRLERGEPVPADLFVVAVEFFQGFADGCHHAKEEGALFPLLAARGFGPDMSVVGALLAQHDTGRAHVREMKRAIERWRAGDAAARLALVESAKAYIELLREHIRIEDDYFYEIAAGMLTPADDDVLVERFAEVERDSAGPGAHEHYEQLLERLLANDKVLLPR